MVVVKKGANDYQVWHKTIAAKCGAYVIYRTEAENND
jgi:hypothetical protein